MSIRLVTLGGLEVYKDGEPVALPVQRRARAALLVFVAVEAPIARERAMSVFWPESDEAKARHALSQSLYQLRQLLGQEWLDPTSDRLTLAAPAEVDAREFVRLIEAHQPDAALALYRGPLLGGVDNLPDIKPFESWLDGQRAHYERMHRSARRQQINAFLERGDLPGALSSASAWVAITPHEDEAQHRLIELLAAGGQQIDAIRQYESYERLLAADDLTPLEDTKALIAAVRARPAAIQVPGPTVVRTAGIGLPSDLEVIRALGEGQMATVVLAREPALKRLVAIKILRSELAQDDTAARRFEREAQAAASISHRNVVNIHRVGRTTAGTPFIVMEYVDGRTLEDVLEANGTLTLAETRRVLKYVAQALSAAHSHGVIHRDLRAGNVMLENGSERVVLLDFGLAALLDTGAQAVTRLTAMGEKIGDPLRMSPEQRAGQPVTQPTDVYALGLLGYELLTARVPDADPAKLRALRPEIDSGLFDLIVRCLAPVPRHRPDVTILADALGQEVAPSALHAGGNPLRDFIRELEQRKVFRALFAYVAATFVLLEGAQLLLPGLPLDNTEFWYRGLVALTLAGFPVVIALSWFFDWGQDGLRRAHSNELRGVRVLLPLIGLALTISAAITVWLILMG